MGELRLFLKTVFTGFEPIMSGVVAVFLTWLIGILYWWKYSQSLPWFWYMYIASFFVFLACYYTWRDQHRTISNQTQALLIQERKTRKLQEALHLQIDDTIQEIAIGPKSRFSPPEKLALLQRKEHELRLELEKAPFEDKPMLIKRLEQILTRQLDLGVQMFQLPSTNYQEQFNKVALKLEELRDLAKRIKL